MEVDHQAQTTQDRVTTTQMIGLLKEQLLHSLSQVGQRKD
jgi:hypothetical protein